MKKDLLLLVDGSSYLYRAFHALPPLVNSKGHPTGAVFGVLKMVRKLIADEKPEYVAVVFDAKGKTFRNDLYPEYKANRPPMPDDLRVQIEPLYEIIRQMHLPLLSIPGVEADDVIGTLAKHAEKAGIKTLVSTGDKDMAQLVNDHVTLVNTMNSKISDREGVIEKFGIPPELIIDYLTLVGDTSDNVPGVPKVGPKTAAKWLNEYGSLDNIIENADKIKGKVGEYLRETIPQLPLSKTLVTIKCDVDLDYNISDLVAGQQNKEALFELYKELEFKGWMKETLTDRGDASAPIKQTAKQYETIFTEEALTALIKQLKAAKQFAFDTETTSLRYMDARIVGLSFATEEDKAFYIPIGHDYPDAPAQLDRQFVLDQLKPLLEDPKLKKIGHNLKYDKEVLKNEGISVQGIAFDTMLESYVLDSTASRHNLDTLALKYLGHNTIKFEDVAGKGVKQLSFNEVPIDKASDYAAEDADIALKLHYTLWPRIEKDANLTSVFETIEMPLINVLSYVERNGVLIDSDMLAKQSSQLEKTLAVLQQTIFDLAGCEFNVNSPKQLQEVLYDKLDLPILKKTPTGQPSTAEPVLQELALTYDLPEIILEFRSLAKLKSTYTDKLPEEVNANTRRVHTSYNQAVAGTGRLSSSDPNLQNIPIRTEAGRQVRKAFIAPAGKKIIAADYSQIELRIMAHLSQDKGLIDAFANNLDIHKATAAQVFGEDISEVTDEQRRKAKAINFGLIYGMSAFGLAKQIGVERAAAQAYITAYFDQYPGVKDYMESTREKAHAQGFVETLFGRKLHLAEINAQNKQRQKAAERAAINAPMQGTAADIIKLAMIKVYDWLHQSDIDAKMIMQVHDELVFEIAEGDVEEAKAKIDQLMSHAAELDVPLIVDIGVGDNWDEAH